MWAEFTKSYIVFYHNMDRLFVHNDKSNSNVNQFNAESYVIWTVHHCDC